MATIYPYAVIDGNHAPDQHIRPLSVHRSYAAARRAAIAWDRGDPNGHCYVREWGARRTAQLRPNDAHYPCAEWLSDSWHGEE